MSVQVGHTPFSLTTKTAERGRLKPIMESVDPWAPMAHHWSQWSQPLTYTTAKGDKVQNSNRFNCKILLLTSTPISVCVWQSHSMFLYTLNKTKTKPAGSCWRQPDRPSCRYKREKISTAAAVGYARYKNHVPSHGDAFPADTRAAPALLLCVLQQMVSQSEVVATTLRHSSGHRQLTRQQLHQAQQ